VLLLEDIERIEDGNLTIKV